MAGYSGTPLIKKLGIKAGMKIFLYNEPENYFTLIDEDILNQITNNTKEADFAHLFVKRQDDLKKQFLKIIQSAKASTIIWISWYKKSAGMETDITEDVIREIVLPTGWVDVKVCAVDDKWSGLKVMRRKI